MSGPPPPDDVSVMRWMDPETLRRLARELYRLGDRNGRDGTHDGHLIAGFCASIAADYHGRALRIEQSQLRAEVEAIRAPTVELPVINLRDARYHVSDVTITYRSGA